MPVKAKNGVKPVAKLTTARAIVREKLALCDEVLPWRAPSGEYDLTCEDGCRICFCHCQEKIQFSLSIDAVIQHLTEGRIALKAGAKLPLPA